MTYVAASVSASATPALALATAIETTLTAHAGWAFVEDYTVGTGRYHVWKNLGSANGFGQDWYLFLMHASVGTGNLWVLAAEAYDSATHQLTRPCPYEPQTIASTNGPIPAADFSYSVSSFPLTGTLGSDKMFFVSLGTSTSAFDYYMVLSNTNLTITTKVTTTHTTVHVGLFDSLLTGGAPDPFPLIIHNISGTQSATVSTGAFSRMPRQNLNIPEQFAAQDQATSQAAWWTLPVSPAIVGGAAAVAGDQYQLDRAVASRVLWSPRRGLTQPADVGFARGLAKDLIMINQTGVLAGDTITIGAATYVYTGQRWHWMNASAA